MAKYTFTSEEPLNNSKITYEFEGVSLVDIVEHFEMFLKGSGFIFQGQLDFVEEDNTEFYTSENDLGFFGAQGMPAIDIPDFTLDDIDIDYEGKQF